MSQKLRNATIFCLTSSVLLGSSLSVFADTTSVDTSKNTTTVSSNQAFTPTATNAEGYIPTNNKSETIYVNLDHYGIPTETQVVNGYRIDGDKQIVDYGPYTNVTNLTNYATPTINGDQITWNLEDDVTNFYYQGTLDHVETPWNFTIRYKLNGVETKAEDLAGASGMIETIINVTPNENVSDYLKNNFFLQLSTSFDMGKCLSVEAPDGVEVTLGATKSITFMAMPGEEATFHVYVGSDCYESSGFNVVIAPLKMSALEDVKELKESKERIEDAYEAANESLDIILDSTAAVSSGLEELNKGIASIQQSLKEIRKDDSATDAKVEALLNSANTLNDSLNTMVPHIDQTIQFANDFNASGNQCVTDLKELTPLLEETKTLLQVLQNDCKEISDVVEKISASSKRLDNSLPMLEQYLEKLGKDLISLESALQSLGSGLGDSQNSLYDASNGLNSMSSQLGTLNSLSPEQLAALGFTPQQIMALGQLVSSGALQQIQQTGMGAGNDASHLLSTTGHLAGESTNTIKELRKVTSDLASVSTVLSGITANLKDINSVLNSHTDTVVFTLDDISNLLGNLEKASDISANMITDIDNTQTLLNDYLPELTSTLQDTNALVTALNGTTTAATDLGSQVHNRVTSNRQHTYDSIDQTLAGSIHTFEKLIDSLGKTEELKKNKDIIKNTIDDEWDKIDEDFNLLDYDYDAEPISLVSDKNTHVDSIQIILRTPEITVDKKAEILAEEAATPHLSVWDRIKNIFTHLF